MNTRSALILGLALILAAAIHAYVARVPTPPASPQIGRYQIIRTYETGAMLVDTATGTTWKKTTMNGEGEQLLWGGDDQPRALRSH